MTKTAQEIARKIQIDVQLCLAGQIDVQEESKRNAVSWQEAKAAGLYAEVDAILQADIEEAFAAMGIRIGE